MRTLHEHLGVSKTSMKKTSTQKKQSDGLFSFTEEQGGELLENPHAPNESYPPTGHTSYDLPGGWCSIMNLKPQRSLYMTTTPPEIMLMERSRHMYKMHKVSCCCLVI